MTRTNLLIDYWLIGFLDCGLPLKVKHSLQSSTANADFIPK